VVRLACELACSHHERWDGGGYPLGLKGEAIPLSGRIVAVADVFDALTHERPYKAAWSRDEALAHLRAGSGTQFCPDVVRAFLEDVG
jgi:putative two-component system response regulator